MNYTDEELNEVEANLRELGELGERELGRWAKTFLGPLIFTDLREARAQAAKLREALSLYRALDEQRDACVECRDAPERAAEACETCCPFADAARCAMRKALTEEPVAGQ